MPTTNHSKLFTIDVKDRKAAVDNLIAVSAPNGDFFLLLVLSVLIVVSGLLINNASVIIGGMVVAPILSPILSMAMGVVLADFKLIRRAARTVLVSLLLVILFSAVMTLFYPSRMLNVEILTRSQASLAHLVIAIASGIAAAFALAKPNLSATIPGIAVSVSLLPPLAVTGIGAAMGDWRLTSGSLVLFLVNLIGIVLASTVVFSLLGFYPLRKQAEVILKEEEKQIIKEKKVVELQKEKEKKLIEAEATKEAEKEVEANGGTAE